MVHLGRCDLCPGRGLLGLRHTSCAEAQWLMVKPLAKWTEKWRTFSL